MGHLSFVLKTIHDRNFSESQSDEIDHILREYGITDQNCPNWFAEMCDNLTEYNLRQIDFDGAPSDIPGVLVDFGERCGWDVDYSGEDCVLRFPQDGLRVFVTWQASCGGRVTISRL